METLGNRIKQAREAAGLSQKDLGALVGVFGSVIGRYEIDSGEPKASMIVKLATALNVSTDYLLGFSVSPEGFQEDKAQGILQAINECEAGCSCTREGNLFVVKYDDKQKEYTEASFLAAYEKAYNEAREEAASYYLAFMGDKLLKKVEGELITGPALENIQQEFLAAFKVASTEAERLDLTKAYMKKIDEFANS